MDDESSIMKMVSKWASSASSSSDAKVVVRLGRLWPSGGCEARGRGRGDCEARGGGRGGCETRGGVRMGGSYLDLGLNISFNLLPKVDFLRAGLPSMLPELRVPGDDMD